MLDHGKLVECKIIMNIVNKEYKYSNSWILEEANIYYHIQKQIFFPLSMNIFNINILCIFSIYIHQILIKYPKQPIFNPYFDFIRIHIQSIWNIFVTVNELALEYDKLNYLLSCL